MVTSFHLFNNSALGENVYSSQLSEGLLFTDKLVNTVISLGHRASHDQ